MTRIGNKGEASEVRSVDRQEADENPNESDGKIGLAEDEDCR